MSRAILVFSVVVVSGFSVAPPSHAGIEVKSKNQKLKIHCDVMKGQTKDVAQVEIEQLSEVFDQGGYGARISTSPKSICANDGKMSGTAPYPKGVPLPTPGALKNVNALDKDLTASCDDGAYLNLKKVGSNKYEGNFRHYSEMTKKQLDLKLSCETR
jgi:hypothetical protein